METNVPEIPSGRGPATKTPITVLTAYLKTGQRGLIAVLNVMEELPLAHVVWLETPRWVEQAATPQCKKLKRVTWLLATDLKTAR
jgi:hypothetical protein